MILYHVTTNKKAKHYRDSGSIIKPVRGFRTFLAAMAWAVKTGRTVVYELNCPDESCYKLPDHHNKFGEAWWCDSDIPVENMKCVFSADSDA